MSSADSDGMISSPSGDSRTSPVPALRLPSTFSIRHRRHQLLPARLKRATDIGRHTEQLARAHRASSDARSSCQWTGIGHLKPGTCSTGAHPPHGRLPSHRHRVPAWPRLLLAELCCLKPVHSRGSSIATRSASGVRQRCGGAAAVPYSRPCPPFGAGVASCWEAGRSRCSAAGEGAGQPQGWGRCWATDTLQSTGFSPSSVAKTKVAPEAGTRIAHWSSRVSGW